MDKSPKKPESSVVNQLDRGLSYALLSRSIETAETLLQAVTNIRNSVDLITKYGLKEKDLHDMDEIISTVPPAIELLKRHESLDMVCLSTRLIIGGEKMSVFELLTENELSEEAEGAIVQLLEEENYSISPEKAEEIKQLIAGDKEVVVFDTQKGGQSDAELLQSLSSVNWGNNPNNRAN